MSFLPSISFEPPSAGTYWVLRMECGGYYLGAAAARHVERQLGRWWAPRWLAFTDLTGSRIRVRRCDVRALVRSTPATRAADRRLERALEQEEKEEKRDRPDWLDE